jgi:hypothetical protein
MKRFPFYALILPLLPILTLQAANVNETSIGAGLRVMGLLLFVTAVFWIGLERTGAPPHSAAPAAAALGLALTISDIAFLAILIPTMWAFFVTPMQIANRKVTFVANIICLLLLVYPLVTLAIRALPRDVFPSRHVSAAAQASGPDIYFIVLDSYTGHSTLLDRFGYDDSAFLDGLRSMGFEVGECRSAGPITDVSLATTLNGGPVDVAGSDLWKYIRHSAVRTKLEEQGYRSFAYATGFVWSEILDADVYMKPYQIGFFSDFEIFYLQQSALGFLNWNQDWGLRYQQRTLHVIRTLPALVRWPGPRFVFAHVITPHPPFVFAADGSLPDWSGMRNPDYLHDGQPEYSAEVYAAGYTNQVAYIGAALLPVLRQILDNSAQPPVIVIEGDHGPWYAVDEAEARGALCAVYAPFPVPLDPVHYFDFVLEDR